MLDKLRKRVGDAIAGDAPLYTHTEELRAKLKSRDAAKRAATEAKVLGNRAKRLGESIGGTAGSLKQRLGEATGAYAAPSASIPPKSRPKDFKKNVSTARSKIHTDGLKGRKKAPKAPAISDRPRKGGL
jgi:hypothetical protein